MPSRLDIPPVYFVASALLMLLLHVGLPGPQLVHWPWRWLGLLPVVGGDSRWPSPVSRLLGRLRRGRSDRCDGTANSHGDGRRGDDSAVDNAEGTLRLLWPGRKQRGRLANLITRRGC